MRKMKAIERKENRNKKGVGESFSHTILQYLEFNKKKFNASGLNLHLTKEIFMLDVEGSWFIDPNMYLGYRTLRRVVHFNKKEKSIIMSKIKNWLTKRDIMGGEFFTRHPSFAWYGD